MGSPLGAVDTVVVVLLADHATVAGGSPRYEGFRTGRSASYLGNTRRSPPHWRSCSGVECPRIRPVAVATRSPIRPRRKRSGPHQWRLAVRDRLIVREPAGGRLPPRGEVTALVAMSGAGIGWARGDGRLDCGRERARGQHSGEQRVFQRRDADLEVRRVAQYGRAAVGGDDERSGAAVGGEPVADIGSVDAREQAHCLFPWHSAGRFVRPRRRSPNGPRSSCGRSSTTPLPGGNWLSRDSTAVA